MQTLGYISAERSTDGNAEHLAGGEEGNRF